MEQVGESALTVNLSTYKGIIRVFLPFIIIRCARFTNSKRLAETVTIYTFISGYYLARMPEHKGRTAIVIGCMADVVGKDLGNGPDTPVIERLFESEDVFNAAQAVAGLNMEDCIAMTLYYVGRHDLGRIAEITGRPIERIVEIIGGAQRLFLAELSKRRLRRTTSSVGLIRRSMDSLADSFDKDQFERIIATVMAYLIRQG